MLADGKCVMAKHSNEVERELREQIAKLQYKLDHAYKLGGPLGTWISQDDLVKRYKMLVCDYSKGDTNV